MMIYVYQVSDTEYGAGYSEEICSAKGRIVERYPINNEKEAAFVERHGSNYGKVRPIVQHLAKSAKRLISSSSIDDPILISESEWDYVLEEKKKLLQQEKDLDVERIKESYETDKKILEASFNDELKAIGKRTDYKIGEIRKDYEAQLALHEAEKLEMKGRFESEIKALKEKIKNAYDKFTKDKEVIVKSLEAKRDEALAEMRSEYEDQIQSIRTKIRSEYNAESLWARIKLATRLLFKRI